MARTAEKVRSLLEEDEEMEDALQSIRRAADENGGVVAWEDVQGSVTSGQWGRIIEKGVLESADGDGFRFKDPDRIDEMLEVDDIEAEFDLELPDVDVDDEESSWSQWDKLAGVATLAMMVGYYFDPVQDFIGGTVHVLLAPFDAVLPFYAVILGVSMFTGLYSSLLQANLMDTEKMSAYQERMKAIQNKRKEAKERGDDEALERIQEKQMEMMGDQLGMFKEQFRPMVWIMLLTIPLFLWMWWMVTHPDPAMMAGNPDGPDMIMPFAGKVEWNEGLIGPLRSWIAWYFVCSVSFTQVMRKSLNISPMPGT